MSGKLLWAGLTMIVALPEVLGLLGLSASPVLVAVGAVIMVIGAVLLILDK